MSKLFDRLITAILAICAIAITVMAARRQLLPARNLLDERRVANWRSLAQDGNRLGRADAPVPIIEFADFQCPSCAALQASLDTVRSHLGDSVAIVYRHYPLRMTHEHAVAAANAAECAGEQGHFFELARVFFDRQFDIGRKPYVALAREAGVSDTARFDACLKNRTFSARVERDAAVADSLNLIGTPTLIVNGKMLVGAVSPRVIRVEVDAALRDRAAR
jgi:protein-disulfide isomerase